VNNKNKAIRLSEFDNVATVLNDVAKEQQVQIIDECNQIIGEFTALQSIPFGNKIALQLISDKSVIEKAGYPIGVAIKAIQPGDLVHVQNVRSTRVDIPASIIEQIIQQMQIEESPCNS